MVHVRPVAGDVNLTVVVGGQYGSEAKGHVTKRVIKNYLDQAKWLKDVSPVVVNIRVAGPNAGHSAMDADGKMWALRQVPVGVVINRANILLHIAPGSEIDLDVLLQEIDETQEAGLNTAARLTIDPEATLIGLAHKQIESDANLVGKIGSTGKGIGAARAERIMRRAKRLVDDPVAMKKLENRGVKVTPLNLRMIKREVDRIRGYAEIVIEGTQGYGLGLHAGHYPQCTSSNCRAIDFLSMAGITPWDPAINLLRVIVVARVFPIRVAGNSGPLKNETTWEALGLPEELTTVTKKVRRVGNWDPDLVRKAVIENGGKPIVGLAITMVDQRWPEAKGTTTVRGFPGGVREWLTNEVERRSKAPVLLATTGPDTGVWFHAR